MGNKMTTGNFHLRLPCEGLSDRIWIESHSGLTTEGSLWEHFLKNQIKKWRILICGTEITLTKKPPKWFSDVAEILSSFEWLPDDWDSYGAKRIDPGCIKGAVRFLSEIVYDNTPPPSVVPTNSGGVQFEWHTKGIDLEIEIQPTIQIFAAFEDLRSQKEWEKEITEDYSPIENIIYKLSSSA
jgi:hypothetical protein